MTMTDEQAVRAREIKDLRFLIAFTIPHPIREFVLSNLVDRGWLTDHGKRSNPCELTEQGKALVDAALAHAIAALSGCGDAVGYLRTLNGVPDWSEDCVCEKGGVAALGYDEADGYGEVALYTRPAPAAMDGVAGLVLAEVAKATAKFPTWPTDPLHAVAVLGEEFGELTKAVLQSVYEPHKVKPGDVREEAVQTAAMALRFLMSLNRYEYTPGAQHSQAALAATAKGK